MKQIQFGLAPGRGPKSSRSDIVLRVDVKQLLAAAAAFSLMFGTAFAQTTRTNPSAASSTSTLPSSSATSPNSPCASTNPTSPCFAAKSPRNPCYDAANPNKPCSTTTTPSSLSSPEPLPLPAAKPQLETRAFTEDQAKAQIEAEGYSSVSRLRRDAEGIWRGKAEKDGLQVNVTLDTRGKVTAN